jgi:hypothetical protein
MVNYKASNMYYSECILSLILTVFMFRLSVTIIMIVKEEGTNKQAVANELAVYSVRALARLGGYLPAPDLTPDNPIVKVHQPVFPLLC